MKIRGKHIILFFVLFLTGFILVVNYEFTDSGNFDPLNRLNSTWAQENELRNQIIMEQSLNKMLQEELRLYQYQVRELEENLSTVNEKSEEKAENLLEDIERLRKIVGQVQVTGPGIEISLEDSDYLPNGANPNDYIVHEGHIQQVVQELYVAGAEAIAVNGYRLRHSSFIQCIGPVISVDGNISSAPFIITAIGDADHLEAALTLHGGVQHQLINDEVTVRIQKKTNILLDSYLTEG
ncbi:DUF881 domain-containing protein [Halalkalibacter akibai]|uniref:Division initiation protein n=1 Tax=Halalkalibacter akibai (strain ATCC 43226 / DSM 21942 / CIP 109018 / JCM 9157 / 1139) TaxID=1236973 RepID=W4QU23_HALA3|nr:DUF881 domain-containing protein [Halalkalibacter akibai]GAE35576.1 division initiation protein [Halalkalibacter akibai JCM 9157]